MDLALKDHESPLQAALALLLVALGVTGLVLYRLDVWNGDGELARDAGPPVATALIEQADVRLKPRHSWVWRDLKPGSLPLSDGDGVFVSSAGQATLEIAGVGTVRVHPNTMVVVTKPPEKAPEAAPKLDLVQGSIELDWAEETAESVEKPRRLEIAASGKRVVLQAKPGAKAARTRVRREEVAKAVAIEAVAGEDIEVRDAETGSTTLTRPGVSLQISEAPRVAPKLVPVAISRPLWPADGQSLIFNAARPVVFGWESPAGAQVGRIEWIGPSGQPAALEITTGERSKRVELAPGSYRWRIVEREGRKPSGWLAFELAPLSPPRLQGPKDGLSRTIPGATEETTFSWALPGSDSLVELEIAGRVVRSLPGAQNVTTPLAAGTHSWRARRVNSRGDQSEWTAPRALTLLALEKVEPAPAPVPVAPPAPAPPPPLAVAPKVVAPKVIAPKVIAKRPPPPPPRHPPTLREPPAGRTLDGRDSVLLTWARIRGARTYQIQVSQDPKFAPGATMTYESETNHVAVRLLTTGRYFWRARELTSGSRRAPASTAAKGPGPWSAARDFGLTRPR